METQHINEAVPAPETFSALVATPLPASNDDIDPSFYTTCGQPRKNDD